MTNYARYTQPIRKLHQRSATPETGNAIKWLLIGVGIGAAATLLLTPANGREMRNALRSRYRRTVDGINWGTRELRQRGSNLLSFTHGQKAVRYQPG